MAQTLNEYLLEKYKETGSPGAYYGVDKFYKAINKNGQRKVSKKQVTNFLLNVQAYTLHRNIRRKFPRRKVIAPFMGYQIDVDCAYMPDNIDLNEGYGYFLVAIDCFSKLAFTKALKSLKAVEVSKALEHLFSKFPFRIINCHSDSGSEFKAAITQRLFKKLGIKHFVSLNETKSSVAERFIKSIKSLLYRYMTSENTGKWVDQIENITDTYNNSFHSTIKRSPASVTQQDEYTLWKQVYDKPDKTTKTTTEHHLKLNDTVRLSSIKGKFDRDFHQRWSTEYFLISELLFKQGIPVYKIKDIQNEEIIGTFYHHELQRIIVDEDKDKHVIEKIIKCTKKRSLVKWEGWPVKYNTWVDNDTIQNYNTRH